MKASLTKGFLSKDAIERSPLTWHYRIVPSKNGFLKQTLPAGLFLRNGFLKSALWIGLFLMNGLFEIGNMGSLKSALWTGFQGTFFFEIATMDWSFSKERLF